MSGGTGIGSLIEEITDDIQAILNCKVAIDQDTVRRLLLRLWTLGEAEINIGGKVIQIKWKIGQPESKDRLELTEISYEEQ
jgi:hypothetical protein